MTDELNLEPYRKAWQAEKERLQSAPPRHSEQDIAAILSRHKQEKDTASIQLQQHRRTLPIWIGNAAASVAILVGVAWMLWLRPTGSTTALPTVAELRPHTNPSLPMIQNNPNIQNNPIDLTTPPSIHSHTHLQEPQFNLPTPGNTVAHQIISEESFPSDIHNTEGITNGQPDAKPSVQNPSTQSQLQAFQGTGVTSMIDKQKTPKDPLVRTRTGYAPTRYYFSSAQVGLSLGATISPVTGSRALVGVGVTRDTKSKSVICANNQGALYLLFGMPPFAANGDSLSVSLHYGYGLSYRPTDQLTLRLNLGGYLLFNDFDLGLRLNAEAGYCITDQITLTASYQYYMPGIVSGDGGHAAILSIGYIFN